MPDKRCPHCHLWNLGTAQVCDCGFDFSTGAMLRVQANDTPPELVFWRISLSILSVVLLPVFVIAAYLVTKIGQISPLLMLLLVVMLVTPPIYWLVYFTCRKRAWARYLMLVMGIAGVLLLGLIVVSIVMRFLHPQ